jgi:hypothetical protein
MLSIRLTVLLSLVALLVIPSINAAPLGEHVDISKRAAEPQAPPAKIAKRDAEPQAFNPQPDPPRADIGE